MRNKNEPWADDKLGRKQQADAISNYLTTRSKNRTSSGLAKGFVLGIESEYGQGKSYFVRNMKASLSKTHPVALIDAWQDDRINSPFLAILDGIENALAPFFDTDSKIRDNADKLIAGSGKLISGMAIGAGKKALEKIAGTGVEELLGEILESDSDAEELQDLEIGDIGIEGVKEGLIRLNSLTDSSTKKGLKEYRQRKLSISRLHQRLILLSKQIGENTAYDLPIFIFIDELDRCRPDYAITLLEEVKHLFDIPGFVFILSLQKEQLLNAIKAVYGSEFDSAAYIDRFIDKYYELNAPNCSQFVDLELQKEPLGTSIFLNDPLGLTDAERISLVFNHYGLSLREMERALDMVRASTILLGSVKIDPIYLTSSIVAHMGIVGKKGRKSRAPFEPIDIEWRQTTQRPAIMKNGKIDNFGTVLSTIQSHATWNLQTVKQQATHIKRPELYYCYQIVQHFFDQFKSQQPFNFTMSSLIGKIISQIQPFEPEA